MHLYFHSLNDFFIMGQHGIYVWLSWGIFFVSISVTIFYSWQQRKQTLKDILKQQQIKSKHLEKQPNQKK